MTAPEAKLSQGEVRLKLGWNYKSERFTHPFRCGEDGFLAGSPENGHSLRGRKISNGSASFSVKTKATAILFWCLYDECSGSSRNKYPKGVFWSDYLLSLVT